MQEVRASKLLQPNSPSEPVILSNKFSAFNNNDSNSTDFPLSKNTIKPHPVIIYHLMFLVIKSSLSSDKYTAKYLAIYMKVIAVKYIRLLKIKISICKICYKLLKFKLRQHLSKYSSTPL